MSIVDLIFQILGMGTAVFLVACGVGLGLRLGLGKPARCPDERKDRGVPF